MKLFLLFAVTMGLFQSTMANANPSALSQKIEKGSVQIVVDRGEEEKSEKININNLKLKNSCFKDSLNKIDTLIVKKMESIQEKLVNPLEYSIDTQIHFYLYPQSKISLDKEKIKELEIKFSLRKKNSIVPLVINTFKLVSPDVCLSQSSNLEFSSIVILSDIQKKYNQYLEKKHLLPKVAGENKQKEGSKKDEARIPTLSPNEKIQRSPSYLPEETKGI